MQKIFCFITLAAALLCSGNAWADVQDVADKTAFYNAVSTGGSIRLTQDIDLGVGTTQYLVTIANDLSIDLNGFELKGNGQYSTTDWGWIQAYFFYVNSGKTLTITGTGKVTQYGNTGGYLIYSSGTVNINPSTGGTIYFTGLNINQFYYSTSKNITGGHFKYTVENYIDKNNYQCVKTGDWYVVSPLPYICTVNGDSLKTIAAALTAAKVGGVITYPIILCKDASYNTSINEAYEFQGSDYTLTASGKQIYAGTYKCKVNASIYGGYFENTVSGSVYGGIHNTLPTLPANYSTITTSDSKYYVANTWKLDTEKNKVIAGAHYMDISALVADGNTLLYSASRYITLGRWFVTPTANVNGNNKIITGYYKDQPTGLMETGYNNASAAGYYFVGIGVQSDNGLIAGTFDFNPETAVPGSVNTSYEVKDTLGQYVIKIKESAIVAKIGNVAYPSVTKALSKATAGQTVVLQKDWEENVTYYLYGGKAFTLDLNGHKLSSESGITLHVQGNGSQTLTITSGVDGGTLEAQNGTALYVGSTDCWCPAYASINNCVVKGTTAINVNGQQSSKMAYITINGGSFEGNLVKNSNGNYTINSGTFDVDPATVSPTYPPGVSAVQVDVNTWVVGEVYFKISTGKCTNGSVLINGQTGTLSVPAGTTVNLTATPDPDYKFVTFKVNGKDTVLENNQYAVTKNKVKITADFIAKDYVCQIGTDGAKFESIKEAVANAAAGDVINVLKSFTQTSKEGWENDGYITIDLNGYTITQSDNSKVNLSGNMTIKNGTIISGYGYGLETYQYAPEDDASASNIVLDNLTMSGTGVGVYNMTNLVMKNMHINTTYAYAVYVDPLQDNPSEIRIVSGEYLTSNTSSVGVGNTRAHKVYIEGGLFNKKVGYSYENPAKYPTTAKIVISGGQFAIEPKGDSLLAPGFTAVETGDHSYPWKVQQEGKRPAVTLGNIGTICLPSDVAAGDYTNATFYEIAYKDNGKIFFDQVDMLEAGHAYVFEPTASGEITYKMSGKVVDAPIAVNGLIGTFVDMNYNPDLKSIISDDYDDLEDMYVVSGNIIQKCGLGCALPANRAYIDMNDVPSKNNAPAPAPGRHRISLTYNQVNTPTGVVDVDANANTNGKFIFNGQLIIVKDGKMFNAQGAAL